MRNQDDDDLEPKKKKTSVGSMYGGSEKIPKATSQVGNMYGGSEEIPEATSQVGSMYSGKTKKIACYPSDFGIPPAFSRQISNMYGGTPQNYRPLILIGQDNNIEREKTKIEKIRAKLKEKLEEFKDKEIDKKVRVEQPTVFINNQENNENVSQNLEVANMKGDDLFKEKNNTGLEKYIFINNKFLREEQEFLAFCGLNAQNFKKARWSWLENEKGLNFSMLKKYFAYVLLPYFIVQNDLSRSQLKKLGFNPFLVKISHHQFHLSKLKDEFKPFNKNKLINILGKDIAIRRLKFASQRILDLKNRQKEAEKDFFSDLYNYSDSVNKSFQMSNKEKFKWMLSRMYKFNKSMFKNLEKDNSYQEIASKFLIYFIKNRFRQSYIAKILKIDKRNLLDVFKKYLNLNFNQAKLLYFAKPIYIKYYSAGLRAYEMIPILSKKYVETEEKFGLSKNTIRKQIKEIWEDKFHKLHNEFSLLDLFLYEKFYHKVEFPKYILKYKTLLKSIGQSKDYGLNYFSFEVRIIKFIMTFGLSAFDGYDLYKHLIDGNKASFHHINFIKKDDRFENLCWLPDISDTDTSNNVDYIYHHHPYTKTNEFRYTLQNNILNLSSIIKYNDMSYLDNIQNYSRSRYELLRERVNNFDWVNGIIYYLPRGTWIKKFKLDSFNYLVKSHIHPKFHSKVNIIKNEINEFWKEYLKSRREQ